MAASENSDNKKQVLRHRARRSIVQMILDRELLPGERINQEKIARKLNISKGVVRESLLDLQPTYLVRLVDHRGAFVGKLDETKINEIYVAREAIECMVVRLCCLQVNRLQIEQLKEIVDREHRFVEEGETESASSMDMLYHRRLLELCGNKILTKIMEDYLILTKIYRTEIHNPNSTLKDHLDIVLAIEENDPDRAEELMRRHIRIGLNNAMEQLRQDPSSAPMIPIEESLV